MARCLLAAVALTALAGCKGGSGSGDGGLCQSFVPTVSVDGFRLVPVEDDPFAPAHVLDAGTSTSGDAGTSTTGFVRGRCGPDEIKHELLGDTPSFSITTLFCSWGTVRAPLLEAITQGETLHLRIWYFSQQAFSEAEAKLEIRVDSKTLWKGTVSVPTSGSLIVEDIVAPFAAPQGAELLWNVSNHGSNSWNFLELSREGLAPCADAGPS